MNTTHCCGAVFYMVLLDLHCLRFSASHCGPQHWRHAFPGHLPFKLLFWGGGPSLVLVAQCCITAAVVDKGYGQ